MRGGVPGWPGVAGRRVEGRGARVAGEWRGVVGRGGEGRGAKVAGGGGGGREWREGEGRGWAPGG